MSNYWVRLWLQTIIHMIKLQALQDAVCQCVKCPISQTKTKYVFAKGNPDAKTMIIAEAPGADEDLQGIPLIGRAGQCLDRAIKSLGFDPLQDAYYANILKCHPPENRRPTPTEVENCLPYLHQQIEIISPKIILALGNTAVQTLLNTKEGILSIRGKSFNYRGAMLIPAVHPSLIIRSGGVNSQHFPSFVADIKLAFELSKEPS